MTLTFHHDTVYIVRLSKNYTVSDPFLLVQITFKLDMSDITSKFLMIIMFVIVKKSHTKCVGIFMTYLHTKFHVESVVH